jgi:hypothetical protein
VECHGNEKNAYQILVLKQERRDHLGKVTHKLEDAA